MQQIRFQLTHLRKKIHERLPPEGDVFDFPGVTSSGLCDCVQRTHNLTGRIEELRGSHAIVALKRKLMPRLDDCKNFLESDFSTPDVGPRFDRFLTLLTEIHDDVSLTHTVYCSEGIRTEAEIEGLLLRLKKISEEYNTRSAEIEALLEDVEKIKELKDSVETHAEEVVSLTEQCVAGQATIGQAVAGATAKAEVITKYETETKTQKTEVVNLATRLNGLEKRLTGLTSKSQEHVKEAEKNVASIRELEENNRKQQETIAQTLTLASKYGMAASFKERKDELRTTMIIWGSAFLLAMAGIFTTGVLYIVPEIEAAKAGQGFNVMKMSLIAPLIWLGWMAAKQYGYVGRIREDYSFKYASALAFEGYKREAVHVNEEMLRELLKVATENMSLNPLRIYSNGDSNHASPVHELLSTVRNGKISKVSEDKSTSPTS